MPILEVMAMLALIACICVKYHEFLLETWLFIQNVHVWSHGSHHNQPYIQLPLAKFCVSVPLLCAWITLVYTMYCGLIMIKKLTNLAAVQYMLVETV